VRNGDMNAGDLFSHQYQKERVSHLDLFSGIGGFAYAMDNTRSKMWNHDFVENELHLQKVLSKNWKSSSVYGDIRDFHPKKKYFIVTGGFPCQDISRANRTKNTSKGIYGQRSGLWGEYSRVLQECRPSYCIIENVHDLLRDGLGRIVSDLAKIGYDAAWTTLDSQFLSAQRRRRVYIVGVRDGITSGSDIFQCDRRTRLDRGKILNHFNRIEENRARGKEHGSQFFGIQKTGIYNPSRVASTIRKCGWATGGDLVFSEKGVRHLTYREKLKLQGFPPDWTEDCGLTENQKHSANGMSIPAVEWVVNRLMEYHETLDI
jgi:DNA-cytosine methyltransferase